MKPTYRKLEQIDDVTVYIKAFCLASMKKQRYQVFLCMTNTDGVYKVDFAYCQCPIGLAQACSHIGGLLLSVCMIGKKQTKSGQNDQSCTSTLCMWKVPRSVNIKPKAFHTLNLSKPKLENNEDSDVTITSQSYGSAMTNFDPRHSQDKKHDLTWSLHQLSELKEIFPHTGMAHLWNVPDSKIPNNIEMELEVETSMHPLQLEMEKMLLSEHNIPPPVIHQELVEYIEEHTREQRESEMWKCLHYGRITSSIFGDVLSAGQNPRSLVNQILHGSSLEKYAKLPPAVQWGIEHELDAKNAYMLNKRASGVPTDIHVCRTGLTLYPTHSFLGASSDGRVTENGNLGLLEIKCPYSINGQNVTESSISDILSLHGKHFCLEQSNTGPTLKKMHKFYAQVQGEMAIIGLPWVDFVLWTAATSNNLFIERIYFDENYVCNMLPKLVNFYMKHVYPIIFDRSSD